MTKIHGKERLEGVTIAKVDERRKPIPETAEYIPCDTLLLSVGLIPENEPFEALADLNQFGYFDTDEQCLTRTPGIFVAGDCRAKNVRQLTTAVADGATAALAACRYINGL